MLSFFRRMRKQLTDDNPPTDKQDRFLKYSRYAFGEIVLVVIGILIALQINNWNEDRKERRIEVRYLENLRADLKNDSLALLEIKAHRVNTAQCCQNYF